MARKYNSPGLTVQTTLQLEGSCLLLDNPGEYGLNLGVIIKIDSEFLLMLWNTNDRKVFEESYIEIVEAQVGFIAEFGPRGMLSSSVPSWTYTDPAPDLMEKLKESVSKKKR